MPETAPPHSLVVIPQEKETGTIREIFPDCPVPEHYRIPRGWALSEHGVFFFGEDELEDARLAIPYPVVILKKLIDLEEGTEKLVVAFRVDGIWKEVTEAREVFANTAKVIALSSFGLPVTSLNARFFISYLFEMEVFNRIYQVFTVTRCGWKEFQGKTLFTVGANIIGANNGEIKFDAQGIGESQAVKALRKAGTLENWLSMIERLSGEAPMAMMAVYHALTPPLMKICDAANYCVDVSGTSSIGKTTFARVGASVWGAAYAEGELIKSWNSTRVFAERWLSINCDLPAFLDETHLAKEEVLSSVVYTVINGIGKGRGSLKGLQDVKSWSTCLFSTGEVPIANASQMEGIRARVVPYWGSPFGKKPNRSLIADLERVLGKNFGHVGPAFVRYLIENKEKWPKIKARFETMVEDMSKSAKTSIGGRVAAYMALTWVAAELFHEIYSGFFSPDFNVSTILETAFDSVSKEFAEIPLYKRGFEAVESWYIANKPSFLTEEGGMDIPDNKGVKEFYGLVREVDGKKELCIFQGRLEKFCKEFGFPYNSLLRTWKEKGISRTSGGLTLPVKVRGSAIRMVVLPVTGAETL